jgi:hypothetical protein
MRQSACKYPAGDIGANPIAANNNYMEGLATLRNFWTEAKSNSYKSRPIS